MVQMLQHIVPDDLFEHFACVEEIKSDHKGKKPRILLSANRVVYVEE